MLRHQLYIKHEDDSGYSDAGERFGAAMGDGFIDALGNIPPLKDYIQFSSRVLPGRDVRAVPVTDSREVTLQFVLSGETPTEYGGFKEALAAFLSLEPRVCVKIPAIFGDTVFHLVYTGKSVTYAESFSHSRGVVSAKFIEPDPNDRGEQRKTVTFLTGAGSKLTGGNAFLVP